MIEILSEVAKETIKKSSKTIDKFNPDAKAEVSDKKLRNEKIKTFDPDVKAEVKKSPIEILKENNPKGLESNREYDVNGHKIETDDNGIPYKENGELVPNNEYNIRGYKYNTDDKGRIVRAFGELYWKSHEGRLEMPDSIHDIGKGFELKTDDRGHLIADEFNGSSGKENLVPMDRYLNQNGDYRKLEREWEKNLRKEKKIYVEIIPEYEGISNRPQSFIVSYDIEEKHYEKNFLNENNKGVN